MLVRRTAENVSSREVAHRREASKAAERYRRTQSDERETERHREAQRDERKTGRHRDTCLLLIADQDGEPQRSVQRVPVPSHACPHRRIDCGLPVDK